MKLNFMFGAALFLSGCLAPQPFTIVAPKLPATLQVSKQAPVLSANYYCDMKYTLTSASQAIPGAILNILFLDSSGNTLSQDGFTHRLDHMSIYSTAYTECSSPGELSDWMES